MCEEKNYNFDEIVYYKKGEAFISNKKFIFIGFKNDSKNLGIYEIATGAVLKIYKKKEKSLFKFFLNSFNQTSYIRVEVSVGGGVIVYTPVADEYTKDEYPLEMQKLYDSLHEAKYGFKKAIEKIEEKKELSILKISFGKNLGIEDGFEINIPSANFFGEYLEKNQRDIASFDKKWIHDLVKIKFFLQNASASIKNNFQKTMEEDDIDYFTKMKNEVSAQVEAYDKVYGNALILIDAIIEKNNVLSFEIYEIFDKLGFFESNWEQRLLKKFDDLADSVSTIDRNIQNINKNFELITHSNISKINGRENLLSGSIQASMPMLALYGGYKIGYNFFKPLKG